MNIGKPSEIEPRLSYLVARLDRLIRSRLAETVGPLGVTVPQYTVLSVLGRRSELSNAQLARRAYVTPQAMHQIVTSLEADGLVERETSVDHGQVRLARLTVAGTRLLVECDRLVDALEDDLFSDLPALDRRALRRLIEKSL